MRCPTCQADNPTQNRFCDQCGAALEVRCPQCSAPLRPEALVREAFAVAQAKKITLPYDDPVRWVREFGSKIPNASPSMSQDAEAGRLTEIDSINGGVVREAEGLGVPVPVNRVLVSLVQALEARRSHGF